MRYLILSDLHANLDAFETVLAVAPPSDGFLILGDIVGYGAEPNAVIDRVRGLSPAILIRGNHDKVACGLEQAEVDVLLGVDERGLGGDAASTDLEHHRRRQRVEVEDPIDERRDAALRDRREDVAREAFRRLEAALLRELRVRDAEVAPGRSDQLPAGQRRRADPPPHLHPARRRQDGG